MAKSPQLENGYTKIANELLEAICRARLKGTELSVVLWIARCSYGWSQRKTKPMGVREMSRMLNAPRTSVHLAVQILIEAGIILRDDKDQFSINKDYGSWALIDGAKVVEGVQPVGQQMASGVQPVGRKVSNPLDEASSPLDTPSSPLDENVQPVGHFTDEPKERKKPKETVKGLPAQNSQTHIPDFSEVLAYAAELGKAMDCRKFFDHYTANGWMRGNSPIADWKAVVRLWKDSGPVIPEHHAAPIPKRRFCARCKIAQVFDSSDYCIPCTICERCQEPASALSQVEGKWVCGGCIGEERPL